MDIEDMTEKEIKQYLKDTSGKKAREAVEKAFAEGRVASVHVRDSTPTVSSYLVIVKQ